MSANLTEFARRLAAAVAVAPVPLRDAAVQDGLDVLAVAAGLKPMAVIGCGYDAPDLLIAVNDAAVLGGLIAQRGRPWTSAAAVGVAWFAEARQRSANPVLYVTKREATGQATRLAGQYVDLATEAELLGYPACCVRQFNRQQKLLHLITIRMIARQAEHDETRMRRLVAAQVVPAPRSATEARRLACATRAEFAPHTSIAMCRICAADPGSPAHRISARFRALAVETGFAALTAVR